MLEPTAYPLTWPSHRPRSDSFKRKRPRFKSDSKHITLMAACERLDHQLRLFGVEEYVLSTNLEPTLAGRPKANIGSPEDPGAAVYFNLDGEPIVLACDTFANLEQNIAGIAGHIEATRRIDNYGVQSAKEIFKSFMAIESHPVYTAHWSEVLNCTKRASVAEIKSAYRRQSKKLHPDVEGGSEDLFKNLQSAFDQAMKERG